MYSWGQTALLSLFLAGWMTVMPQEMMISVMPDNNQSAMAFPPMTPEFKEMAKKLMLKCSKMGYQPPSLREPPFNSSMDEKEMTPRNPFSLFSSLLSSLPLPPPPGPDLSSSRSAGLPNGSVDIPAIEADWNVTEELWNVTTLPDMIDIMKNSTDHPRCFMQAFISPVAWSAVMHGGLLLRPEVLAKLLWAAKPLMENMPPYNITLPPHLDQDRLTEMMRMFSEVFGSLSEDQREQIRDWVKVRVLENVFNCTPNGMQPKPMQPAGMEKFKPSLPSLLVALRPIPSNTSSTVVPGAFGLARCPPSQRWLNRSVLRIMGRFLSRLPPEEVQVIPKEELCEFFRSPHFPAAFQKVWPIQDSLGRTLLGRIKKECSVSKQDFLEHTASLGSLACFYDGEASSLNNTLSQRLLAQLDECQNSASTKLKQQLVRKLFSSAGASPGPGLLKSLGSGVSMLSPSKLTRFSAEDLASTLPDLRNARWSPAQASTLAKALLKKGQNISGDDLLSLGTVAQGVASSVLRNIKGRELLREGEKERLEAVSLKMSALQRRALIQGMRGDVNVSELVLSVPAALLSSMSLSTLKQAQLTSVEQLEGRSWTRAQSAFLVKKILGQKLKVEHLRKLDRAVQGVTCEMIDSLGQNETMEGVAALSQSGWLAKAQTICAARKLFDSLEQKRRDYFRNVSSAELQRIPTMMIIHLPVDKIRALPASVCGVFLDKMKTANLFCLPHSSPSRTALTQKALDCLGKNMSELSTEEVMSLGPLLCDLRPSKLRPLAPEVLNNTLLGMASTCTYIRGGHREELFALVKDTFGEPSNWSEVTVQSLRPFLLLDDYALRTLPDKPWLRSALSDLMDSLSDQPSALVPEEFRSVPDLSTLRWKLFVLASQNQNQTSTPAQLRRRRREAVPVGEPTADLIEQLGQDNVFWSPAQLASMSCDTFNESASRLGAISQYTAEQLASLRQKTIQCWGAVTLLTESQAVELGCVSQGFSAEELRQLNVSSLDTLQLLSACMWTQTQRAAMWQGFAQRTGVAAAQLSELDIVGLGQFICGLQKAEVEQLSSDSFREAAGAVGGAPCEVAQMECFKNKAVATFGRPQDWSEGQVMALGNIMAGLDAAELQSLNPSVFSFIVSSAIPLIPPQRLAALSVSQVQALGPDNAAVVTDAQKAGLGEELNAALAEAVGVAYARSESSPGGSQSSTGGQDGSALPQGGGAGRNTMMSLVVILQPLLFLLLGFM
ncbi:hypothetical protein ACEWY4_019645 [Coilia grayii]|uniref:Stereocilin LRR domain-containing protein n=1 Tax=Coilia grayii TaxID=363190 RepID=A0ABD1JA93_9TELE